MFLSVRQKAMKEEAYRSVLINRDTGEQIPRVIWANDETGRYRQHLVDEKGKYIIDHEKGCLKSKIFKGNIEIRRKETA